MRFYVLMLSVKLWNLTLSICNSKVKNKEDTSDSVLPVWYVTDWKEGVGVLSEER